ncbi:dynein light chain Tctex-type 1 [Angomonas deanei]|nr:dynein light chain Tctex-type 1 [Angomonas deanei]|eukprot:EPY39832.1 dynein light chain Tctex-type 1 [Angomonas deanei]
MADYDREETLDDDTTFSSEAIHEDIVNTLKTKLGEEEFNTTKVDAWTEDVICTVLKDLSELKKPFKYIVNCVISQKTGAAISTGFISLWDNAKDGMVHVPFENHSLHCLVTVYF